jgi:hypothetical protein
MKLWGRSYRKCLNYNLHFYQARSPNMGLAVLIAKKDACMRLVYETYVMTRSNVEHP